MDSVQINIINTPNVVTANITESLINVVINITNLGPGLPKTKQAITYAGGIITLTRTCTTMLSLNWGNIALNESVDYTFSGDQLTILNTNINNGDQLYATFE